MDFIKLTKVLIIFTVLSLDPVLSMDYAYGSKFIWIIKCCEQNYTMNKSGCIFNNSTQWTVPIYEIDHTTWDFSTNVKFAHFETKCIDYSKENFILQPQYFPFESFFLQNDGRLWVPNLNTSFSASQFCLESFEGLGIIAAICIPGLQKMTESVNEVSVLTLTGLIISLPFLLATFVVYALLPERNLYGMCLMSYVFALFWAYFLPVFCYIYSQFAKVTLATCRIITTSVYFFFIVSFFWMNVIAFDMWLTFSGNRKILNDGKKRIYIYSTYAWGMPLLLAIVVSTVANTVPSTAWYFPFGEKCWFKEGISQLLYIYGPMGILIAINICFFVLTSWKIIQTRKQTVMLRQRGNRTQNSENEAKATGRFKLYVKLMFAMGINWSVEFIQWIVAWQNRNVPFLSYLTHFCNGGLGVFIFFMFVFKRNIWNLLKKRYYMVTGKAQSTESTAPVPYRESITTTNC